MKEIIIVGAGGFGRELLQWIKDINSIAPQWIIKGFVDDNLFALDRYDCDYNIIGSIIDWNPSKNEVFACAIANPKIKEETVKLLKTKQAKFVQVIHPKSSIGEFNKIGEGVIIYPNAGLTVNIDVGDFVTLLSSRIGHDVSIDNYTTISSNCSINGNVKIGKSVFIGSNCVIAPSRKIGDGAFIGTGSVVVTSVKDGIRVLGNPAKKFHL